MTKRRYTIPSSSALVAFEAAARHANFSRAAVELNTSQSAISRHIADLEARMKVRLFSRDGKKMRLTEQGEHFHRAVVSGLENIQSAARAIAGWTDNDQLTIACTHEISHLFLMPRFEALQTAVGDNIQIRLMTFEYDALEASLDPRIDISFTYRSGCEAVGGEAVVFREAVRPVCSPAFAEANAAVLARPVSAWAALPFLQLTKQNKGWATWRDWFTHAGASDIAPGYIRVDNYVYLLEAAAAGRGIALGWRGLIERHIESGALTCISPEYVEYDRALVAVVSPNGRDKDAAATCLEFLRNGNGT